MLDIGREHLLISTVEGRNPPLKVISNEFIANQEEKIEAFRSRGVVRITATKEKSENIFQAIRAALRDIRSLTVDLNPLIPSIQSPKAGAKSPNEVILDESSITELARLTETHIARLSDNQVSTPKVNWRFSFTDGHRRFWCHASMRNRKRSYLPKPMLLVVFCSPHLTWHVKPKH